MIKTLLKSRLIKEPFVHFILLGGAIFAGAETLMPVDASPQVINVAAGEIERLKLSFLKSRQRAATEAELQGLLEDLLHEEVFYREAQKLGLDSNDTIIRRRLRQKYEFLIEDQLQSEQPSDHVLQLYLNENMEKFKSEQQLSFLQLHFKQGKNFNGEEQAKAALAEIQNQALSDNEARVLGANGLLPAHYPLTGMLRIDQDFGPGFSQKIAGAQQVSWQGPYRSETGWHLVKLTGRQMSATPSLEEVRSTVLREWQTEQRAQRLEQRFQQLSQQYQIIFANASVG